MSAHIAAQLNNADQLKGADDPLPSALNWNSDYMDNVADCVNAAKQGYVDDVIEPATTRQMLISRRGNARGQARYEARQEARQYAAVRGGFHEQFSEAFWWNPYG